MEQPMMINQQMQIRVFERKIAAMQEAMERTAASYLSQVDRANRLTADLQRARAANAKLLACIAALTGYPVRTSLGA